MEARQFKHKSGIETGYKWLDVLTCGLQKSNIITICGACGSGKRAFAYSIARNIATSSIGKMNVALLNLSLSNDEAIMRLLCLEARVDSLRTKSGYLSKDDWAKLTDAAELLTDSNIFFYNEFDDLFNKIRSNCDLIIIDSFQRLQPKGIAANINQEQISYTIMNDLKDKALKIEIPIIILSSLNDWRIDQRADKRPRLTDFKYGYSALADISDVVISVYRDEMYNLEEDNPNRGTAEIGVLKQRTGPTGMAVLTYLNSYCRFEDLADEPA